eukprot:6881988-Pyramimonas_sp.AAC.1
MMWDVEGFYDALKWKLLLESGLEHGFPPSILALEIILHMGARFLRDNGYYSGAIIPEKSLIAGLGGAVEFSRCALCNILDRVAQGTPAVVTRSWVGDVSQRVEGRCRRVLGLPCKLAWPLRRDALKRVWSYRPSRLSSPIRWTLAEHYKMGSRRRAS